MVFQKRKYTLNFDLSFCYIFYVLKIISFRLKEEKRSLDADWSRVWCRFLLFFTAPHCIFDVMLRSRPRAPKILLLSDL